MVSSCLLTLTAPGDFISCLNSSSGNLLFNIVFYALIIVIVGGWSLNLGIPSGMSVGGFLCSLIGIVGVIFGYLGVYSAMFSILITVIGVLMLVIEQFKS